MKPFIFFGLYAFISFCSFSSQGKEVEVSSKGLAYYFLQQESVFNNKDIKNEFLAQFFSEKEIRRGCKGVVLCRYLGRYQLL